MFPVVIYLVGWLVWFKDEYEVCHSRSDDEIVYFLVSTVPVTITNKIQLFLLRTFQICSLNIH